MAGNEAATGLAGIMKLTIERGSLLKSLAHVQSVVERRNTIPILANVLIQAHDERIALTATDMDLDIVERAPAHVASAGATTASGAHALRHRAQAAGRRTGATRVRRE